MPGDSVSSVSISASASVAARPPAAKKLKTGFPSGGGGDDRGRSSGFAEKAAEGKPLNSVEFLKAKVDNVSHTSN